VVSITLMQCVPESYCLWYLWSISSPPVSPLAPPQALLERSPNALLATSVRANEVGDEARRLLEPSRMLSEYAPRGLAFVVDGGPRPAEVSTVRFRLA
jgi:hypothetical protein